MKNKLFKIKILLASLVITTIPIGAYAQYLGNTRGILLESKNIITDILIPLAFLLAVLFFFWGIAKYVRSSGNEKEEGKKIMVWGVIALFVMSSVWGLVAFIKGELRVPLDESGNIPTIQ